MTDSQPDSKRASMLSKVGNAVGKTYNLFQVLFHVLKHQTEKSKAQCLCCQTFEAKFLSGYYVRCRQLPDSVSLNTAALRGASVFKLQSR